MTSLAELEARREELCDRMEDLELQMIRARGAALKRLTDELEQLEDDEAVLKRQIKTLKAGGSVVATMAAPPPLDPRSLPPPPAAMTARPGPAPAQGPMKRTQKGSAAPRKSPAKKGATKRKRGGGKAGAGRRGQPKQAPAKKDDKAAADEAHALEALEAEVAALRKRVAGKSEELSKRRFEMLTWKRDLYQRESTIWSREHRVIEQTSETDAEVRSAVIIQRWARKWLLRRRWRGKKLALLGVVDEALRHDSQKEARARWSLLLEVHASEQKYLEQLNLIAKCYVDPLKEAAYADKPAISPDDVSKLFSTLEVIISLNVDIANELHDRFFDRFTAPLVGDIFIKMSPLFPMYVQYCKDFDQSFAIFERLQSNRSFTNLLVRLQKDSGSSLPLTSLMELPCKRIFHYETIVSALVKATSRSHQDFEFLKATQDRVSDAIRGIQAYQREKDERKQLLELEKPISNLPETLAIPGRKFVKDGVVSEVDTTTKPKHWRKYQMFLFSDIVIRTKMRTSKAFTYIDTIASSEARVMDCPDDGKIVNVWKLQTIRGTWSFACESASEKRAWLEAVRLAVSLAKEKQAEDEGRMSIIRAKLASRKNLLLAQYKKLPSSTLERKQAQKYHSLMQLLSQSDLALMAALSARHLTLQRVITVMDAHARLAPALMSLVRSHVHVIAEPAQLFLKKPLITKSVVAYTRAAASGFLGKVIRRHVIEINAKPSNYVLDASQVSQSRFKDNVSNVKSKLGELWEVMVKQVKEIPPLLRQLTGLVVEEARKKWAKSHPDYNPAFAGGAFLWLLLFSPAMRTPTTFNFVQRTPTALALKALREVDAIMYHTLIGVPFGHAHLTEIDAFIIAKQDDVPGLVTNISAVEGNAKHKAVMTPAQVEAKIMPELFHDIMQQLDSVEGILLQLRKKESIPKLVDCLAITSVLTQL